ncbi:HD domain-containing phosphohydrolase [Shewanella acanthi]|uniref:HD domain-containing phosphohydrolase n=1 Tax=Shewanella acanthi TaxID=2864212 RepID=UPI001C660EA6|nr:HD domain-containing phosphohydrolase [Shewanella acanthi]QYJ77883.1 response regulator [Shewanella acanthi]
MFVKDQDAKIMICDDSITNTLILSAYLKDAGYELITTLTIPEKVVPELANGGYQCLILDIEMPQMSGFDVMELIRETQVVDEYFPIIIMTGRQDAETRNRALESGAADFINKPFDQTETLLRIRNALNVYRAYSAMQHHAHELERQVEARTKELSIANSLLIERLAKAGELKDCDTGRHVLRVGKYARVLAEALHLPGDLCFMIEQAAPLHDLGKIGIPDAILLKPGKLNAEERLKMNEHTKIGAALLENHQSLLVNMGATIALSHHECWDGTGYPSGLQGESIPIEGRITAICDVFDALTTKRPYKEAWSVEDALTEINQKSGKQFDPDLVRLFVANLDKILTIKESYRDNRA